MSTVGKAAEPSHVPVLLHEAVEALALQANGRYIDATYGRGGHSSLLMEQLGGEGRLLALDRDPDAVANAHQRFAGEARFTCVQCNFGEMESAVNSLGWKGQVNGVLMDLGVSSPQLDVATRGFSFSQDAPLDMRMDPSSGQSAAQWLASVDEERLAHVLKTHGDERYARRIAKAIVLARADTPITRTAQLAEIIKAAHPRWERHHHPATRSFQAIRIEVNRELESISQALGQAANVLVDGGRLSVISFHSLEDRLVKRTLRKPPPDPDLPRGLPVDMDVARQTHPWKVIGKPAKPSSQEVLRNPRSRSATLRVAERVSRVAA